MDATPDLTALLPSWELHLRAERKSGQTVRLYLTGVRAYLRWCAEQGRPVVLDRAQAVAFIAQLLDEQGLEAATARARHLALRRFAAWLVDEGELDRDPLVGMRPPKLDDKVVAVLSTAQCKALLRACEGKGFRDRRDEALVRLLLETGLRAGEAIALETTDVDLADGVLLVARGKGGKGRLVPFGA
ncbi:MAG TPA: tyrosine-type recombinase/integrase, partial [Actinomycetes bacterium]|nr:tyrosine-type recombinase/integrase [Actinomycetes bacterium]